MSKFIEVTVEGEKRIICIGVGIDIYPPNEVDKKVVINDHNLSRSICPDETYEEIKAMLGIVND